LHQIYLFALLAHSIPELTARDSNWPLRHHRPMSRNELHPALRAARHFVLVANGRNAGAQSRASFNRDVQHLMDTLWEMGIRPSPPCADPQ